MSMLDQLKNNKGTVSSKLSESFAEDILAGNTRLLEEAIPLVCHEIKDKKAKQVRSGAAKIVECVAMRQPELVTKYLPAIFPALEAAEPQTRWVIIRTIGICAVYNRELAKKAIPFAKAYIREKREGLLCLASSADLFLGDYGALSKENAAEVYKILLESADTAIKNEHDWIFEAFMKIVKHLTSAEKKVIASFAEEYEEHPRKATRDRVKKLLKMCSANG